MKPKSHSHSHPGQTNPDIYATNMEIEAKPTVETGSFYQWGINLTLSGRTFWKSEAVSFNLDCDDLLISRPDTVMSWRVVSAPSSKTNSRGKIVWGTVYTLFHPRPHWHEWLDALEYQNGFCHLHLEGEALRDLKRDMIEMARVYDSGILLRDERTLLALENVLLTLHEHTAHQHTTFDSRIRRAIELIHARYAQSLLVPDIAQAVGLSESHFAHLFTAVMDVTPARYIEQFRLTRAAELLRFSDSKIATIAKASGYDDPNYFTYRFRANYGQTPKAYRAASRPLSKDS